MQQIARRFVGRLFVFATLLALASSAFAQSFPTRPIRLVAPYAPGGTTDILARLIAPPLWNILGQPVVVDNRPGGGSNVGLELVAKADPDGYTLVLATPALASNPTLYRKVDYDPVKSFAPITLLAEIPIVLVVNPKVPAKTVGDLIRLAKASPGKLNFGSSGNGGIGHLVGELFRSSTGTDMVHVPFKGNGPALVALMQGEIDLTFSDIAGAGPYIKAGKMRPLGVTSAQRTPALAEVPTLIESGVPGFQASTWFALFATGGTPKPVIDRLNQATVQALGVASVRDRLGDLGVTPIGNSPSELDAFLRAEIAKWSKAVKASGARIN